MLNHEFKTITQVSKAYGISSRMLRYYEKAGLLKSQRIAGYAYRVYDEEAVQQVRQILILRKLRIPVKEIAQILKNPDAITALGVFQKNISELDDEIHALSTVRSILMQLLSQLEKTADVPLHHILTADDSVLIAIDSLALSPIDFKEDQTMKDLEKADRQLSKLTDIRIITLPPATVAAAHHIGNDPEAHSRDMMDAFVKENRLWELKPDLRHYGFNHPNPRDETGFHGYEIWVTIPDDLKVPKSMSKKHFPGGLYAVHTITFGNFNEFEDMLQWIMASEKYEFAGDMEDQDHMCGLLDEHLNYVAHAPLEDTEPADVQFDLMMPIREK